MIPALQEVKNPPWQFSAKGSRSRIQFLRYKEGSEDTHENFLDLGEGIIFTLNNALKKPLLLISFGLSSDLQIILNQRILSLQPNSLTTEFFSFCSSATKEFSVHILCYKTKHVNDTSSVQFALRMNGDSNSYDDPRKFVIIGEQLTIAYFQNNIQYVSCSLYCVFKKSQNLTKRHRMKDKFSKGDCIFRQQKINEKRSRRKNR